MNVESSVRGSAYLVIGFRAHGSFAVILSTRDLFLPGTVVLGSDNLEVHRNRITIISSEPNAQHPTTRRGRQQ